MPAYPSSLSLTNIADGALAVAADERNNFNAIQTYTNALLTALAVAAKGDILGATGANAVTPVTVGANGKVLVADSTQTAGLKWDYPPGYEFARATVTGTVTISGTSGAQTTVVGPTTGFTFDGSTSVDIIFGAPQVQSGSADTIIVELYEDATSLGIIATVATNVAGNPSVPVWSTPARRTPSNASHTYTVKAYRTSTNGSIIVGAGGAGTQVPGFVKVVKV